MAKTYHRICVKDHVIEAQNGDRHEVKRGVEYLTSDDKGGEVIVFGSFWTPFPADLFVAPERFT
jgi:hypothetical protein